MTATRTFTSSVLALLRRPEEASPLSSQLLLVLAVLVLVVVLLLLLRRVVPRSRKSPNDFSSSPTTIPYIHQGSWPFLGQALSFLTHRPWDLLMQWHGCKQAQAQQSPTHNNNNNNNSPILSFWLVGEIIYSIACPTLVKQLLQSKIKYIQKDVQNTMKHFLCILGQGIVTSEGHEWWKQRLKMSHPLRIDVLEVIPILTQQALERLCTQIIDPTLNSTDDNPTPIPIGSSLRHLTLQVISAAFLSLSHEESNTNFAKLYLPIVDEANQRVWHPYRAYCLWMPFWWKHHYNIYRLNRYVSQLIQQRYQQRSKLQKTSTLNPNQDILDHMLQVYETEYFKAHSNSAAAVLPQKLPHFVVTQLRDEIKSFILAGHETSAAMMTWTLYECMGNPHIVQQLRKEAQQVFPKNFLSSPSLPNREQLAKLEWSEACLRESLRKYSVVPIVARRTKEDVTLTDEYGQDYFIPKGSSTMINIQAIHLNEKYWPEPLKYKPERFLPNAPPVEPFTFLAFIGGPRNCLGQHLALLESKMVMSWLLLNYDFTMEDGEEPVLENWWNEKGEPSQQDPRHAYMVPVIPKTELMVFAKRRKGE